jgi:hypothetical protein
MNNNIQVSFDFDSTLSRNDVQDYARFLINKGFEVWILTSRFEDCYQYPWYRGTVNEHCHHDLYIVANSLNIPPERIIFTNMADKADTILEREDFNPIWHLDDDYIELNIIHRKTTTKAISVISSSYKKKCNKELEISK